MKKRTISIIIAVVVIIAGGSYVYANSKKEVAKHVTEKTTNKITNTENKQGSKEDNQDVKENNKTSENYNNPTYKTTEVSGIKLEVPTFLKENGKNAFMSENEKVQLVVDTTKEKSIKEGYNNKLSKISSPSYKYLGKDTYSLSWETDGLEFYQSGVNHNGNIVTFTMSYPKEESKELSPVVTKVYDSFVKNKTENKEEFTYDNATTVLNKYLTDIGYSFKKKVENDTEYTFGLEKATNNPSISLDDVNKENADTVKCAESINKEKYKYKINYMNYVKDLKNEQGHASRIATFYVTPNGIYFESIVTMDIVKVANIKDGQVQVIEGKSRIEKG